MGWWASSFLVHRRFAGMKDGTAREQGAAQWRVCGKRMSLRARRPHASARVGGGSVPQARHARLISAWTAEIRGRSMKIRPRHVDGPRPAPQPCAERPSTRAVSHRPNPPPTLSEATAWRGYKYRAVVFGRGFGIVG